MEKLNQNIELTGIQFSLTLMGHKKVTIIFFNLNSIN